MTTSGNKTRVEAWRVFGPILGIVLFAFAGLLVLRGTLKPSPMSGGGGAQSVRLEVGAQIPDFTLQKHGGDLVKLSDIKAKVVLVNFWATWCSACVLEMPSLVKLRKDFADKGFEVIAINLDENQETVVPSAVKQLGIDFPVYMDPTERIMNALDVRGIPLTFVMDNSRKVLFLETGERDWNSAEFRKKLEAWLNP